MSASEGDCEQTAAVCEGAEFGQTDSTDDLYYVGIGSSAGGLEALRTFVAHLPVQSNMCYIVAQHMSPEHRSMMVELLVRETTLKVVEARNNVTPLADTVYVAPPSSDITIRGGKLRLSKPKATIGPKPSVDLLFISLAEDRGEKAIGIVFSGTGSDGAHGIKAIRAVGGISIAQEPTTAKFDSMPKAAIRSGGIDLVLSPKECAEQLTALSTRPRVRIEEEKEDGTAPTTVREIIRQISSHTGMDFSNYKDATISRQVQRRMAALQVASLEDYGEYAARHHEEYLELANSFLICVTSFFRDSESFEAMRKTLRELLHKKEPGDSIRVWVPGCATGEEAYSIGIILAEELGADFSQYRVQIFGTDINDTATQFARRGIYPEAALANLDETLLRKYFSQQDRMFCVDRRLKDVTVFARQDLVQDPPFVRLDMVSCRNLMIYFKTELQEKVLKTFHYSLLPHGVLFLGKSESVGQMSTLFIEKGRKAKVFSRRDVPTPMPGHFTRAVSAARSKRLATVEAESHAPSEMARARLFDMYSPATILVTSDGDILEFLGDCTPFIKLSKGKADFNLFSVIHSSFRSELRAFAHRVGRNKVSVSSQPNVIKVDGEQRLYRMAVHYVGMDSLDRDLLTVCFERAPDRKLPADGAETTIEEAASGRITELEHELTSTRENLQTVVEELETSNEELQALNEEAQAANEELQASNEELETSNEELQATNEELTTVNDELVSKTEELSTTNDDLENVLDSVLKALVVVDQKLRVSRHNRMAMRFFSFPTEERMPNLTATQVQFDVPDLIGSVRGVIATGDPLTREFTHQDNVFVLTISPYLATVTREVRGAILTFDDITDRKKAEEKLRLSATVFEAASEATVITDSENRILSVNPAFTRITGYTSSEVIGQDPKLLSSGRHSESFYMEMWTQLLETGHWQGEVWNKRKNSEVYPEWLSISLLRDDAGKVLRYIAVFSDITDDKKAQEIIKQQANYDTLTGLPNRNLFFDRLQDTIRKASRFRHVFCLMFIDLDGFKGVNDTLGHAVGDKLLKEVAIRLTGVVRESDTVGRMGGDEFTVLLNEVVSVTDAAPIAEKILRTLAQPYKIDKHTVHVSASIGITVYPDDGTTIEVLLKNADSAMYSSKSAGRNTFRFFTMKMQDEVERRHRLANDLKNALNRHEFFLHYQPIIDLRQRKIVAAEALIRWDHPRRGSVPPAEFIPICEEIGMIGEVGLLVVRQACAAALEWQEAAGYPVRVTINRSAVEFYSDASCDMWRTAMHESTLPGTLVGMEITESVMLADGRDTLECFKTLREAGCQISLDDFGTGYSSLSYLKRLPVDTLKIDRSFISDLDNSGDDAALVEAIISMAHRLGIEVVAEGVETEAQRDFLLDRGCEYGQGFFFSKPVLQADLLKLLADPPARWWMTT